MFFKLLLSVLLFVSVIDIGFSIPPREQKKRKEIADQQRLSNTNILAIILTDKILSDTDNYIAQTKNPDVYLKSINYPKDYIPPTELLAQINIRQYQIVALKMQIKKITEELYIYFEKFKKHYTTKYLKQLDTSIIPPPLDISDI